MSAGKPTASPARFPYTEHRTMAEVMADEAAERIEASHRCMLRKSEAA